MRSHPKIVASAAAIVSCMVVLAACGSSTKPSSAPTSTGAPTNGGSAVIAVYAETNGWNPHYDQWAQAGSLVGSSVIEPLASMNHALQATPYLATSWSPSPDYKSWTIHLRQGITFQDGEPFNAEAVKDNIEDLLVAPLSAAAYKGLIADAAVIDPNTVRIDVTQPWAAFPSSFLDGPNALMMAPKQLTAPDGGQNHPIGTGPFVFQSWTPGDTFVATKNPSYWQKGLPHLNQVTFKVITDPTTMAAALQSGSADMIFTTSPGQAQQLASQYHEVRDWETEPGMAQTNTITTVNGKFNPMSNLHARLALAYATDRRAIATAQGQGVQSPNSPFPPTSPWGMPESKNGYPDYDIAKAKQQVSLYEQQTHQPSLDITLSGTSDSDTSRLLQTLQAAWKRAGINTTIQSLDAQTLITEVVEGKYQVVLFSIYSAPDPDENYLFWSSANAKGEGNISINFTQYKSTQIDHDLAIGRSNPNTAARKAAYDDIVRQINAAAINIWTYTTAYTLIPSNQLHGYEQAEQVPFGNYQPKLWLADLWKRQ